MEAKVPAFVLTDIPLSSITSLYFAGMKYFVEPTSIVRTIWGKGDTVLFVFAGAAAEFALNKAVDWLYFTGTLPGDPFGQAVFYDELCTRDCILRRRGSL